MKFIRKFVTILKIQWQSTFVYPGALFLWMFSTFFVPFIMLSIWVVILRDNPELEQTRQSITTYYLLLPIIRNLVGAWHGIFLAQNIKDGRLNILLTRPITPFETDAANNLAEKVTKSAFLLPMVALSLLVYPLTLPHISQIILMLPALLLGAAVNFAIKTVIGLFGFYWEEVYSLEFIFDAIYYSLGGLMIPVFLLPQVAQQITLLLPFYYVAAFPLEILSGVLFGQQIIRGFMLQFMWLALFLLLSVVLWRKGLKKYSAYGG